MSILPQSHEIYTVSQFNMTARALLEESFQTIWIMGEISNLARPTSGHLYFSLKDHNAQIRCAFFRNAHRLIRFIPENGQQVLVQAQVSLYEPRGDFQLIILHMEATGDGALQLAFEKLKRRLADEGLFAEEHKKILPEIPQCVGVITSATGAAIHDILKVLRHRFPSISVIIYPSLVQGSQASAQLVTAIETANRRKECDVLILARGGGSLEDLWPFNEEIVARAIYASYIPIVTGIGHEVDFTIADFVADVRAATPSAAAETVSPNRKEWRQHLRNFQAHLSKSIQSQLKHYHLHLTHLSKQLCHPGQRLRDQAQRLDQIEQSLLLAQRYLIAQKKTQLAHTFTKLDNVNPKYHIEILKTKITNLQQRLKLSSISYFQKKQQEVTTLFRALDAMSPLKILQRGYAILTKQETHAIIRSTNELKIGEHVNAQLALGKMTCIIEQLDDKKKFKGTIL